MAIRNLQQVSIGDGLETIAFRADRRYLLQSVSMDVPSMGYVEVELSQTTTRRSGMFLASASPNHVNYTLEWHGFNILEEGMFVLAHWHDPSNGDLLRLDLDIVLIKEPRFQVSI